MKSFLLDRDIKCTSCYGTRCLRGTLPSKCWTCYGKGIKVVKVGPYLDEDTCHNCKGSGITIKKKCLECQGEGLINRKIYEKFKIPPLTSDNKILKYSNKGHHSPQSYLGNLFVKIKVRKHPQFTRDGLNIFSEIKIPYHVGMLGGEITVKTLLGEKTLGIGKIMQHNSVYELKREGISDPKTTRKGSHFVTVSYEETKPSSKIRDLYKRLKDGLESN